MFRVFEERTADQVWCQVAQAFRSGEGTLQPSRAGEMREILHSAMSITEPTQRWVTSRHPPINPAFGIAEVVWIITGRNDSLFLNYFNNQLPKYAGHGETYHGAYGHRLRNNLGIDQLERAYQALKANPSSRQVVLQIWDACGDLPNSLGKEASTDVPCNLVSILKVRDGKLEWMQIMRSNDLYRGLPYNIVQFTTLQEVMAGWLSLDLGEYNQISNSLHVYEHDLEYVNTSYPAPCLLNTDSLAFPKEESDEYFQELAANIESIIDPNISANTLISTLQQSKLPESFRNMLRILCAEGARRRQRIDVANDVMRDCTNPIYQHLYERWLMRCGSKHDTQSAASG
jgi:thymidylate synthase